MLFLRRLHFFGISFFLLFPCLCYPNFGLSFSRSPSTNIGSSGDTIGENSILNESLNTLSSAFHASGPRFRSRSLKEFFLKIFLRGLKWYPIESTFENSSVLLGTLFINTYTRNWKMYLALWRMSLHSTT